MSRSVFSSIIVVSAILLLNLPSDLYAKSADPYAAVGKFFRALKEGKVTEAYEEIFKDSKTLNRTAKLNFRRSQLRGAIAAVGNPVGYEFIKAEKFGKSVQRLIYLYKGKQIPLVFEFYFYKPGKEWFLNDVMFTDDFDLVEKSLKLVDQE